MYEKKVCYAKKCYINHKMQLKLLNVDMCILNFDCYRIDCSLFFIYVNFNVFFFCCCGINF